MSDSTVTPRDTAKPRGIDPRGPRFVAGITTVLLLVAVFLSLTGISTSEGRRMFLMDGAEQEEDFWVVSQATLVERILDPGFLLLLVIALLFLWAVVSPRTAPWGVLYRRFVQPRLKPPTELEDPRPPRFAQGVGLVVVSAGLVLHLAGVPWALPIAAAAAFIAAFLNAVIGLCLGCQLYLLLQRVGLIGRRRIATA
jgi:hypothetical protein